MCFPFDAVQLSLFLLRLQESQQQTLPHSDVIASKLEGSDSSPMAEDSDSNPRVILLTDPDCPDSDTWSGWMKSKQELDVPCSYSKMGPIKVGLPM